MEALQTLGTAMGLSMLAGIDLYLTVFITGMAINQGWIHMTPQMSHALAPLGDPLVITIAGVMLVIEFIIDKCPYADSGWDTIHTIVRPIGGAILGLKVLGSLDPSLEIVGVLLGGSIAFTAHAAKAGTRLLVNTSPEPLTNIGVSVAEDALVIGSLWFVNVHPILTLVIVTILVVAFWYVAPKFFRLIRMNLTGILHRFRARRHAISPDAPLLKRLPEFAEDPWLSLQKSGEQIVWSLPCFSGNMKSMGRHVRGCLIGTTADRLVFIGKKNFGVSMTAIALAGAQLYDDPGAVYHRLSVTPLLGDALRVRFTRKFSPYLPKAMQWIRERGHPTSSAASAPATSTPVAALTSN